MILNTTNSKPSAFQSYIYYLVLTFFTVFPFMIIRSFLYGGTSFRSTCLILLTSIIGVSISIWLFNKRNSVSLLKSPILIAVLVLFVSALISAIFGLDFNNSFWSVVTRTTGVWYLINLGILIMAISWVIFDRKKHKNIILSIVLPTVLYSVLSFLGPEGLGLIFSGYIADGFTFGNSTFGAMYIFGAFLLSLYYLFQSEVKKWWMYLMPALLVINPYILSREIWYGGFSFGIVGEARASTYAIAMSVVAIFFLWLISKIKDRKIKIVTSWSVFALSMITVAICAVSLLSNDGYLRKVYLSQASGARPLVWEVSSKIMAERPYLGWGTDSFERVFENNYDNRILQGEYGNEAWFDRAHNILIDQIIDNGIVGLALYILVYLVIIACLIYTSLYSVDKKDRILSAVLITYFTFHFFELQTAFDTSISYPLIAFMIASAAVIFHRTISQTKGKNYEININQVVKYVVAIILLVFTYWFFVKGLVPFVQAQMANRTIRTVGNSDDRIRVYGALFNSPVDEHAFLWRTSTDFQRGVAENPKILEDSMKVENLKKELSIFENEYKEYIEKNPSRFRAYLNLADILIYQRLFGIDKLAEAQSVLDKAIELVPQSPQPYWMKAVAYIYMKKFDLAREYAKKAYDLNPKIRQSQELIDYVEKSIKNFPDIDLFFFRQI